MYRSLRETHRRATELHLPYGITHLTRSALTPA